MSFLLTRVVACVCSPLVAWTWITFGNVSVSEEVSLTADKNKFNEGKSCDAVISLIEAREGAVRMNVRFPDKEDRVKPQPEVVCEIGGQIYAFEHTCIEPFSGHYKLQQEASRKLQPIRDALDGNLPPGERFQLHIPAKAMEGLKGRGLEKVQRSIVDWVIHVGPSLQIAAIGRYITPIQKVLLCDFPFEVSLRRSATDGRPGSFNIIHEVATVEEQRFERIQSGYNKKVPKIEQWRQDSGARSILIFEDNDNQLTNPPLVADAVIRIEQESLQKPDEIYLVTTSIDDTWYISALRINNDSYYSLCATQRSMTEVNPNGLHDLTQR